MATTEFFKHGANIDIVSSADVMLDLYRFSSEEDSTLGIIMLGPEFLCFTVEDEKRLKKIPGETRIPAGEYEIKLRKEGGFHQRYAEKYGDMHKGMLHLQDVPNFEYILIHTGNTDDHSEGCIIVGNTSKENITNEGFVGDSVGAYKRIYPTIAGYIESGKKVVICIHDNI